MAGRRVERRMLAASCSLACAEDAKECAQRWVAESGCTLIARPARKKGSNRLNDPHLLDRTDTVGVVVD
jgi:hypothetical protein